MYSKDFSLTLETYEKDRYNSLLNEKQIRERFPVPFDILEKGFSDYSLKTLNGISKVLGTPEKDEPPLYWYPANELVGLARCMSIPNLGHISNSLIRHTEIMFIDAVYDQKTDLPSITMIYVAAAYMRSETENRTDCGKLVWICPFCGCMHSCKAGGPKYGLGDRPIKTDCINNDPTFYRLEWQTMAKQLDLSNFSFCVMEVGDWRRAGTFPENIRARLADRTKENGE